MDACIVALRGSLRSHLRVTVQEIACKACLEWEADERPESLLVRAASFRI